MVTQVSHGELSMHRHFMRPRGEKAGKIPIHCTNPVDQKTTHVALFVLSVFG